MLPVPREPARVKAQIGLVQRVAQKPHEPRGAPRVGVSLFAVPVKVRAFGTFPVRAFGLVP